MKIRNLIRYNIFEDNKNIDRRIEKGETITELNDYSSINRSSVVEKYFSEISRVLNESSNSKQYQTTLGLRVSNVENDNGYIKYNRKFNLPENISESRLYMCSILLKKIIKQVKEEDYYISDGLTPLFYHLYFSGVSDQVKYTYDKTIGKIDVLKNYFWQLSNGYLSDNSIDKYNLRSLKTLVNFLK